MLSFFRQITFTSMMMKKEKNFKQSHFSRSHWARATTETMVKLGDLEEPILALMDHGSKISLMSKTLYQKEIWPMVLIMDGGFEPSTLNQVFFMEHVQMSKSLLGM